MHWSRKHNFWSFHIILTFELDLEYVLFNFSHSVDSATVMEIDHDVQHVYTETVRVLPDPSDVSLLTPSSESVAAKLTSPVITTYIDTANIEFER